MKSPCLGLGQRLQKSQSHPEIQKFNDLTIGDVVTAKVLVENKGAFPLKVLRSGPRQKRYFAKLAK
jgi:hypothetical protein